MGLKKTRIAGGRVNREPALKGGFRALLLLTALLLSSCNFLIPGEDSPASTRFDGSTRVFLNLQSNSRAPASTILDWGNLIVSATDMLPITEEIDDGSLTLEVPSGNDRLFVLTASTSTLYYIGQTTADLVPGETVEITIPMKLLSTKLLIPDILNNRIVQIDDISGDGWSESALNNLNNEQAVSMDFDDDGYIYALVNGTSTKGIRTNNFAGAATVWTTLIDSQCIGLINIGNNGNIIVS